MRRKECIAMLLAGGQGSRLGILTRKLAKPAVPFGGKYRIIDFTLSNCYNSGIDTVGVLTQYKPLALNSYIGIGSAWDLDRKHGGVFVLPPYVREKGGEWYKGTADAIYQNINFIDMFDPAFVMVLSGDHIYKMDYSLMLGYHKECKADATIAVIKVPWEEASRFGIMNTNGDHRIIDFEEKPPKPQNNLASMGIYIFNWKILKKYLLVDSKDTLSYHDFGKNVIPAMLDNGLDMYAYPFEGYWKDVGTVESFWEANMDILKDKPELQIYDPAWRIYSVNPTRPPHYLAADARITSSVISEGCQVHGQVDHSVVFPDVRIGEGTIITDSIIMSHVKIGANVTIKKAIIGRKCIIKEGCIIGDQGDRKDITVIADSMLLPPNTQVTASMASDL